MKTVRYRTVCIMQHHFVKNEGKQEHCIYSACICKKKKTPKNKTGQDKLEQWLVVSRNGYWAEYQDWEGYFSLYIFL